MNNFIRQNTLKQFNKPTDVDHDFHLRGGQVETLKNGISNIVLKALVYVST